MKKTIMPLLTIPLLASNVFASPLVICDFENYEVGQSVVMWNKFGEAVSSTATVEIDPTNPSNKVLHVQLNDWNTYAELPIPGPLKGNQLTNTYSYAEVDVLRSSSDQNDYKQFWILIGDNVTYQDDGYPNQGDKNKWQKRKYELNPVPESNNSNVLHIGMHSDNSDYYLDNIVLKGKYDDYVTISDGVLDICIDNTDKNYVVYNTPLFVPANTNLKIYTARYTEFLSDVAGEGQISMFCGGERTFLGTKDGASYPNWTEYTGDLHVYPYTDVKSGCGFYGLILNSGGKTFNPEDIDGSLKTINQQLINNTVYVHDGATLALPKGTRGVRIGTLNTEIGSRLCGSLNNGTNNGYYVVGASGEDAVLAGRIAPLDKNGKPSETSGVGFVKEGSGIYRITGNNNLITAAIRVREGKVMLNNNVSEAESQHLPGSIGSIGGSKPGVYVFNDGTIGGYGHSASVIDLYGNLEPGDCGIGTFTIADYENNAKVPIRLHPNSKLHFEIAGENAYDKLVVSGAIEYNNMGEDFIKSDLKSIIYLEPITNNNVKAGDEFTLITASSKALGENGKWNFRIQYPKCFTWEMKEIEENGTYKLVAVVKSLEYSGQGDISVTDPDDQPGDDDDDDDDDGFDETTDPTPLRTYATKLNKFIGVATPCWSYDLTNDNVKQTALIGKEFNALVSENGMKFDQTEPSRGNFDFTLGDRVTGLGSRHNCIVRGHTFAWHKQVAGWVTSNGEKNSNNFSREELLEILKNHIYGLANHFKGKVREWDVVNECLSDNQTAIRTNPDAYDLRPSVWYTGIGEDFIDSAFVWAHRADPTIKLYLTDYGAEFKGLAKTEALYNLAKRLIQSNIPIDGVGLQCHFDAGSVDAKKMALTIESYEQLGLECIITELDLGVSNTSEAELKKQAKDYAAIAKVWLTHDNCPTMIIWGLADVDSWRQSHPLLFDDSANPKQAYYAVHKELRKAANSLSIDDAVTDDTKEIISVDYYNLQGMKLERPSQNIVIMVTRYSDGSYSSKKIINRP